MQPDQMGMRASVTSLALEEAERTSSPGSSTKSAERLERRVDGKLWIVRADGDVSVEVVRCFPWTEPRRFLSLRSATGEERAFIEDTRKLDPLSRTAVESALAHASFVLEITAILEVEEDFELRSWSVQTRQGPRRFQTELDAWPRQLEGGALIIQDVYADLYCVTQPETLDAKSRRLLWAFVD